MTGHEAPLVERLSAAGNPRDLSDWERRDGHYLAACRVAAHDVPGLIDMVRKWTDPNWPGDTDGTQTDQDDFELLPVTAWRTLADLKADAAVEPLIDLLCELGDEFDDWAAEDLPHVFGKIGESAIDSLTRVATNDSRQDFIRSIAARGLCRVAHNHPHTRDRIVACLAEMMAHAADNHVEFNSTLLTELVDLQAAEAAESIERAFAGNLLDVGMMGSWEEVRRELGVEGLSLKMPENPYNSLEQWRRRVGIGIFSDRPVFSYGEIDHDAEQAYYQRAYDTFSKSSEAKQAVERYGDLGWFRMLLEFGLNHLGESVEEMTLESVQEYVLDFVPRKVSTEAEAAAAIIGELAQFWKYLERVYQLPAAKAVVEWLRRDGLVAQLQAKLSNPDNYSMAKSMFMAGKNAGYDMTSETGLAQFMAAYNASLHPPAAAAPIVRNHRVGRNDPCPCGSGKKFKKCCGRTH